MGTLLQDVRYGIRMLVKNPGYTLIAVLTLALHSGPAGDARGPDHCTALRIIVKDYCDSGWGRLSPARCATR
jgi:hypothetical protein